jgi:tRNA threonylcarbamoyladenosine dehydratase
VRLETDGADPGERARSQPDEADLERRFGGVRRLYGRAGYERLRSAHVAVVGLGGVGSWAVEALARSGVATLTLIDLDHVSESNINRQLQALDSTLGMAKAVALRARIAQIHPRCEVNGIEAFVEADNWPALLQGRCVDGVIDACDQLRAKQVIGLWSLRERVPVVCVGAAGGKRVAQRVEVADLADVAHDPLLAALRQRLRKAGAARSGAIGLRCVFSREAVMQPDAAACDADAAPVDGSLNCHGYGSSVAVTATFGMVAAGDLMQTLAAPAAAAAG